MCPSTITHHKLTELLFGDRHENIHKLIDSSTQWKRSELKKNPKLKGLIGEKSHRQDVVHQPEFWKYLLIFGKITPQQYLVAHTHFLEDRIDTSTKHGLDMLINPAFKKNRIKAKLLSGKPI